MNNDKYNSIVNRKFPVFYECIAGFGQTNPKYYKGILGKELILKTRIYLNNNIYWSRNEMNELSNKLIRKSSEMPNFLNKSANICYQEGSQLIKYSEYINNLNLSKFSNSALIRFFSEFADYTMRIIKFLNIPIAIEDYLTKSLLNILSKRSIPQKLITKYFKILTLPIKQNYLVLEKLDLLKISLKIKENKRWDILFKNNFKKFKLLLKNQTSLYKIINNHLNNYAWLTSQYYIGKPIGLLDLYNEIKSYLKININKEISDITMNSVNIKKDSQSIMDLCHLTASEKKIVWLIKEYVFLRTYRTDIIHKSGYNVRNLIKEIGKRTDYTYYDMIYLTLPEIKSIFTKKVNKRIIAQRRKSFAWHQFGKNYHLYIGNDIYKFYKLFKSRLESGINKTKEIKGQCAYRGRRIGTVKVVLSVKQIKKVKKGDIFVTSMTTPVFLPALKKATACITDEGGILCHASIVSREMKIPCIIGTKIATQVLKDGDLVEVDANKGMVRII